MKPNHHRPPPILTIIPRLNIILIIRLKPPDQPNPLITIRPIDLHCVADAVQLAVEARAGMFYDIGFVARGGARRRFVVDDVVGPFPFGARGRGA